MGAYLLITAVVVMYFSTCTAMFCLGDFLPFLPWIIFIKSLPFADSSSWEYVFIILNAVVAYGAGSFIESIFRKKRNQKLVTRVTQ